MCTSSSTCCCVVARNGPPLLIRIREPGSIDLDPIKSIDLSQINRPHRHLACPRFFCPSFQPGFGCGGWLALGSERDVGCDDDARGRAAGDRGLSRDDTAGAGSAVKRRLDANTQHHARALQYVRLLHRRASISMGSDRRTEDSRVHLGLDRSGGADRCQARPTTLALGQLLAQSHPGARARAGLLARRSIGLRTTPSSRPTLAFGVVGHQGMLPWPCASRLQRHQRVGI